jgi:hypothetical protein
LTSWSWGSCGLRILGPLISGLLALQAGRAGLVHDFALTHLRSAASQQGALQAPRNDLQALHRSGQLPVRFLLDLLARGDVRLELPVLVAGDGLAHGHATLSLELG